MYSNYAYASSSGAILEFAAIRDNAFISLHDLRRLEIIYAEIHWWCFLIDSISYAQ